MSEMLGPCLFALGCLGEMQRRLDQQTAARGREYEKLCVVRNGWVKQVRELNAKARKR